MIIQIILKIKYKIKINYNLEINLIKLTKFIIQ